jgi:hypothetical protein
LANKIFLISRNKCASVLITVVCQIFIFQFSRAEVFAVGGFWRGWHPTSEIFQNGVFRSSFPRPSHFGTGATRAGFLLMNYSRRESRRGFSSPELFFAEAGITGGHSRLRFLPSEVSAEFFLARGFLSPGGTAGGFFSREFF